MYSSVRLSPSSRCSSSLLGIKALLLTVIVSVTWAQQGDECPKGWYESNNICYQFSDTPTPVQMASIECQYNFATLVNVRTYAEHQFIVNMLEMLGSARELDWFTSGYRDDDGKLKWSSDNSLITTDYFPSAQIRDAEEKDTGLNIEYDQIVYRFDPSNRTYVWAWSRLMTPEGYICQIDKADTWMIYQQQRDFSYGTGITDPTLWKTGPNITYHSPNTLFFSTGTMMTPVVLDCLAVGNPEPTYKWFRQHAGQQDREDVTSALGEKYVVTNGRLTISDPTSAADASLYTCEAENELGKVQSNPIEVSYGILGEFSNDAISATPAKMYMGVEISCQSILSNTDLAYNWNQGTVNTFIRPSLNPQYFLSQNGHLYISEVQAADQGEYRCMVEMVPKQGQVLAASQAPSRTSLPINLNVAGENANTYGPDIQDKFPAFFPNVPMVGERVEIECLAYGRLPLYYSWRREDGAISPDVEYEDHNRRLIIPNAQLDDTGAYTCVVKGNENTATKTAYLSLKAPPTFPHPLSNQHLDRGSDLSWTCLAIGVPLPTYTWYKNGEKLTSDSSKGIKIVSNILTITSVDTDHEGMYQCEATNSIGMARSSAQLRTLSFAPTFEVTPVQSSVQGAEGGDVTIACQPQAAPRADIRWEKNGMTVGTVAPNGDLQLTGLNLGDAGDYVCVATNDLGEARSQCNLIVQAQSVFTEQPEPRTILMNETTTMPCKASFDRTKTDVVYSWSFNDHVIDFEGTTDIRDQVTYSMPYATTREDGMLYITNAQYKHEGMYTCHVSSVTGSISSSQYLTVTGPPGEPGGVHARNGGRSADADNEFEGNSDIELWWQKGHRHGFDVTFYIIEYHSYYDEEGVWVVLVDDLTDAATVMDDYPEWQSYWIREGLSPGTSYNFRVRSCNPSVGCSPPSSGPYTYYRVDSAKPIVAPDNVRGGKGASGLLRIKWDALPRSKWGGDTLSYILYYRKQEDTSLNRKWIKQPTDYPYFNVYVGVENYYLPYEVKVQAKNEKGEGPNSTVAIVYSAMLLPDQTPTFVAANGINGTAGTVEWIGVPNTREAAHGTIGGYQINYWEEGNTLCDGIFEYQAQSINIYGDQTEGLLIGMIPGGDYCVNIQLYNDAGLGPKTDNYYLGMNDKPPSQYPEYVTVMSHGSESVRLLWDGVYNEFGEEPIRGYMAWWWEVSEDIRTAREVDFGKTFTGVLHNVEKNIVYRLRMMAYSNGGHGAKSPDVFFTLGGQVRYDPLTMEIMNSSPGRHRGHSCLQVITTFIIAIFTFLARV